MYLQLADNGYGYMPETALSENRESPFLFVPGGMIPGIEQDVYVNEKEFDNLPSYEWNEVMTALEPYQENNMGLWPFSGKKGRQRRADRKKQRQDNKLARITTRASVGGGIGGIIGKIGGIFKPQTEPMDVERPPFGATRQYDPAPPPKSGKEPGGLVRFYNHNKLPILIGGAALVVGLVVMNKKKKKKR